MKSRIFRIRMKEQHNRDLWLAGMLYSCVDERQRGHEQYTADHSLGYIIAGSVHLETAQGVHVIEAGSMGLVRRNQLVKSLKVPPSSGAFRAINIIFSQDMLRQYSAAHHIQTTGPYTGSPMVLLPHDPFIKGFFDSLLPYFENPEQSSLSLSRLKSEEAIALLLRNNPLWKDFLFDFSEPYKIDLETFMQQHFTFNVPAAHFARMSGRSLAGFKRDFEKTFGTSPRRWLQQRRLEEAYRLMRQGSKPSDVYLEVGFENLSHFSFAFKKAYGKSPSLL